MNRMHCICNCDKDGRQDAPHDSSYTKSVVKPTFLFEILFYVNVQTRVCEREVGIMLGGTYCGTLETTFCQVPMAFVAHAETRKTRIWSEGLGFYIPAWSC